MSRLGDDAHCEISVFHFSGNLLRFSYSCLTFANQRMVVMLGALSTKSAALLLRLLSLLLPSGAPAKQRTDRGPLRICERTRAISGFVIAMPWQRSSLLVF